MMKIITKDTSEGCQVAFIHFTEDFLGRGFFELAPEMKQVRQSFEQCVTGT